MKTAGYSKTPLYKKLGIKEYMPILVLSEPKAYEDFFEDFPKNVSLNLSDEHIENIGFIHLFCKLESELRAHVPLLKSYLDKNGMLWVSWPKGSSKLHTNLNREIVRAIVLEEGLVDIKVCAVDNDWSALKFMYRKKDR